MSKEIKKTEKPELSEQDLDKAAGGKTRNETRSNTSAYTVQPPAPPNKTPGTNSL